jgi:glycosyltransferase involved in cell wall biosynthesis
MRILFFIGSLRSGGKERRLIELLTWLKQQGSYELYVVLTYDNIDYPAFHELGIPYRAFFKKLDYRWPSIYWKLDRLCKEFKPDIIHTWGYMRTFNMLPLALIHGLPVINSEITNAKPSNRRITFSNLVSRINFRFSSAVTANSMAGLHSFGLKKTGKYKIIYNGINLNRFVNLAAKDSIKKKFGLTTKHAVVMVASFNANKDFAKYIDVGNYVSRKRNDITFFAVGDGKNLPALRQKALDNNITNITFTGQLSHVEALVSVCDVGLMFTNPKVHGEGISNSIMEYMALGKPVIANDAGGTKEIVHHNENGYLVSNESVAEIGDMLIELIDNNNKRTAFGQKSRQIIETKFSLEKMGEAFEMLYHNAASESLPS